MSWPRPLVVLLSVRGLLLTFGGLSNPSRQQRCLHLQDVRSSARPKFETSRCFVLALVVAGPSAVFKASCFPDFFNTLVFLVCLWSVNDRFRMCFCAFARPVFCRAVRDRPIGGLFCQGRSDLCPNDSIHQTYLDRRILRRISHRYRNCLSSGKGSIFLGRTHYSGAFRCSSSTFALFRFLLSLDDVGNGWLAGLA